MIAPVTHYALAGRTAPPTQVGAKIEFRLCSGSRYDLGNSLFRKSDVVELQYVGQNSDRIHSKFFIADFVKTAWMPGDKRQPVSDPGQVFFQRDLNAMRKTCLLGGLIVIPMMPVAGIVQNMEVP